jgi:hypothetical protein
VRDTLNAPDPSAKTDAGATSEIIRSVPTKITNPFLNILISSLLKGHLQTKAGSPFF